MNYIDVYKSIAFGRLSKAAEYGYGGIIPQSDAEMAAYAKQPQDSQNTFSKGLKWLGNKITGTYNGYKKLLTDWHRDDRNLGAELRYQYLRHKGKTQPKGSTAPVPTWSNYRSNAQGADNLIDAASDMFARPTISEAERMRRDSILDASEISKKDAFNEGIYRAARFHGGSGKMPIDELIRIGRESLAQDRRVKAKQQANTSPTEFTRSRSTDETQWAGPTSNETKLNNTTI